MLKINLQEDLKLSLAFIKLTFNTKGTSAKLWIPLIIVFMVANVFLWPFVIITGINMMFHTNLRPFDPGTFIGFWLLSMSVKAFLDKD